MRRRLDAVRPGFLGDGGLNSKPHLRIDGDQEIDHGIQNANVGLEVCFVRKPEADRIETTRLACQSAGSLPWVPEAEVTRDGRDAARSGGIPDRAISWIGTAVTGPGTLQFWWKVSSETGFDYLRLLTNGVEYARISGEVDWEQRAVALPAGTNLLRWQYEKDVNSALGQDRGWLDEVLFTPGVGYMPSLLSLRKIRPGQFRFILNSEANGRFAILHSTNLVDWTSLLELTNTTGEFHLTAPVSNAPTGAYFQSQRLP